MAKEGEQTPPGTPPEPKSEQNPPSKTFSEADVQKAIEAERAKHQKDLEKFKDHDDLKKKLAQLEAEKLSDQEKAIKEREDAIRAELEPQLTEHKDVLKQLLEIELSEVPEDKRDLIPELSDTKKLIWLRNAKAKGLFGSKEAPPTSSTNIPPGNTPNGNQNVDPKNLKVGTPEYEAHVQRTYGLTPKKSIWDRLGK